MFQLRTNHHIVIARLLHFRAGKCHRAGQVCDSLVKETTNDGYIGSIERPHRFSPVHWFNVVDLHSHISGRVRSVKFGDDHVLCFAQTFECGFGADRQIHLSCGEFCQSIESCLQICLPVFQQEVGRWSQRCRIKTGHEDVTRLLDR
ncbi:hypothetical protein SDC9_168029 [bioreactor metagenome]|uniref:Uncharacterized protein n=1 Tax=bioreactor metagenome TaxID=1076179 RepID=A0A645G407_9ZZZZ